MGFLQMPASRKIYLIAAVVALAVIAFLALQGYFFNFRTQTTLLPQTEGLAFCTTNQDCTATCCGCYNQSKAMLCEKQCDQEKLTACICENNLCVATNVPLPK